MPRITLHLLLRALSAVCAVGSSVFAIMAQQPEQTKPAIALRNGVVNAASFQPVIAPEAWITIFGTDLAPSTRAWRDSDFVGRSLPTELDGVGVLVNGKAAFVSFISPTQINAQVPSGSVEGMAQVEVVTPRGKSDPVLVSYQKFAPALFVTGIAPANPGEALTFFGTGFGPTNPELRAGEILTQAALLPIPVSIRIGDKPANIIYQGLIQPGLFQFNVIVPDLPDGEARAVAEIEGFRSQENTFISVQRRVPIWKPPLSTSWQWQLTTPVDRSLDVQMYDIDGFSNDAGVVAALHAEGRKVICYISAGSWEDWRPDAKAFPDSVKGNGNGWPGEKWLDIRKLDILGPLMEARLDLCKNKRFDGVEPDNIDGYANKTGFPLTYADQIRYNTFLANAAHARGLSIGLKNDSGQSLDLVTHFDWALNEECLRYKECDALRPFIAAGKAVFHVEYNLPVERFCPMANAMNFNSLSKRLNLDAFRIPCR